MARRYTLKPRPLDRSGLVAAVGLLALDTNAGRWGACRLVIRAAASAEASSWLWAYGLHAALAGQPQPLADLGWSEVGEGYRAGLELLPGTASVELERPIGVLD